MNETATAQPTPGSIPDVLGAPGVAGDLLVTEDDADTDRRWARPGPVHVSSR